MFIVEQKCELDHICSMSNFLCLSLYIENRSSDCGNKDHVKGVSVLLLELKSLVCICLHAPFVSLMN